MGYRAKIEKDLAGKCNELLDLVHNDLLPSEKTAEGNVFYLKMAGGTSYCSLSPRHLLFMFITGTANPPS